MNSFCLGRSLCGRPVHLRFRDGASHTQGIDFGSAKIAVSCAEFATTFAGSLYLGQASSGFCLRGFKCEQLSIRCRQPTRYLAYSIEERIRIGRFNRLSLGCNSEVPVGGFIGFVSAEHPLGSRVIGSSSCAEFGLVV